MEIGESKGATAALATLNECIAALPASAPLAANHLLITLSAPDAARHFPNLGIDFDLRPHREACFFTPGSYSLPHYDEGGSQKGQGGLILAGWDRWKGRSVRSFFSAVTDDASEVNSQPKSTGDIVIVGGDFVLKGVHAKDDHGALARVLRLGVGLITSRCSAAV